MILTHATLATMDGPVIRNAALVIEGDKIAWAGPMDQLAYRGESIDLQGKLVTPGLIDCHTHLVHGGTRAAEFEARLNGASYEEIARAGGGIASTVAATRAASEEELRTSAQLRLDQMRGHGVTTVEVKSGYGLDIDTEIRLMRVAQSLHGATVITSFLGAHATPPAYQGRADAYLTEQALPALRAAHAMGLVDAVDGFCEGIAFSPAQIERIFVESQRLGLPVKLHADQLSNLGGGALAARFNALSADHLEYLDEDGARAMAASGTVAVILPGAFYTLRETKLPPINLLRRHAVPMAVATDYNPGTAPMTSLPLAMNMACTLFRMTVSEVLQGVTIHAATALGLKDRGRIAPGLRADLAIWQAEDPAELCWRIGATPLHSRIFGGQLDA